MQSTTTWLCMNLWVSLTHVLHKKDPFDLFLTINESLAWKGLLAGSICFLRQSIGQALWGRQVVWGVRKKNPLSSLTIRDFLCSKVLSSQAPFYRGAWLPQSNPAGHWVLTGKDFEKTQQRFVSSKGERLWKVCVCQSPFNSRPACLCPTVLHMWLWFVSGLWHFSAGDGAWHVVLGVPKILESSPYLPSSSLDVPLFSTPPLILFYPQLCFVFLPKAKRLLFKELGKIWHY